MNKKFKLTEETITLETGQTLHRIEALRDFGDVKKGDKGGFVETEENLSHLGTCWVGGNGKVLDEARVLGNARVWGSAEISGGAVIWNKVNVWTFAKVSGDARICGDAEISGYAKVSGDAKISRNAKIGEHAEIFGDAIVHGFAEISGNAIIDGNTIIDGSAKIKGDAKISSNSDFIVMRNTWSSRRHFTYTKSNDTWEVGCFYGTSEELIKKAYADSELSGKCYEASVNYAKTICGFIEESK